MAPNDPPASADTLTLALGDLLSLRILSDSERGALRTTESRTAASLVNALSVLAEVYRRQSQRDPMKPENLATVQAAINAVVAAQAQASASRAVDCVTITGSPHKVEIEGDIMEQIRTGMEGLRKDELGTVVAASTGGKSMFHSKDEDARFVEKMTERSKDDSARIVGSEIRKLCMIARRALTPAKPMECRCQGCGKSAQVHAVDGDASIAVCPHCWHVALASPGGLVSTLVPLPDKPAKIAKRPLLDGAPVGTIGVTQDGVTCLLAVTEDGPALPYRWTIVSGRRIGEMFDTDEHGWDGTPNSGIQSISYPAPGHTRVTKEA
jgi:ribosomal protein S27E